MMLRVKGFGYKSGGREWEEVFCIQLYSLETTSPKGVVYMIFLKYITHANDAVRTSNTLN